MKPSTVTALEILQSETPAKGQPPSEWLDQHQEAVVQLLADKSEMLTAELLGIAPSSLHSWRVRRGLKLNRTKGQNPRHTLRTAAVEEETTRLGPYWQGRAEALELVVRLLLARGPEIPAR